MDDSLSYPPIEPSSFDLIVVGTGLPESILAAAASASGKTVLHLDPNPFYGSHHASLPLHDLLFFLQHQPEPQVVNSDHELIRITSRPIYSHVEVNSYSELILPSSRKFSIDLVGPRVLFCADAIIDLVLRTEVNQYMEFKGIDGSYVGDGEGGMESVPDSRSAIFKDRKLSLQEKNRLMRFFKVVKEHAESEGEGGGGEKIAGEDLEMPFMEFLDVRMGLSKKLREIILYAIAMADYDQENADVCKDLLKTKDGINRLGLYHSSVGRFPNAPGAMIYPIYGQGELPQAFCRRAAVKGCIYVLRMAVVSLLMDKDSGTYKGVKVASGQELFSNQVIFAPSFICPSPEDSPFVGNLPNHLKDFSLTDSSHKLAKAICISNASIKPDVANCLVFYPPRSLNSEQVSSVRVLQLSSNVAVCPPGMFVTYLSAPCDDYMQGKNILQPAIDVLFSIPVSGSSANSTTDEENENAEANLKPSLLWSAFYIQELTSGAHDSIVSTPMPDGDLHYNNIVDVTKKLFQKMYPDDEFFPKTNPSNEVDDDIGPEVTNPSNVVDDDAGPEVTNPSNVLGDDTGPEVKGLSEE